MSESRFLSRKEAASALGVSVSSIVRGTQKGQIPTVKIGERVLIPAQFVDQLVEKALHPEAK